MKTNKITTALFLGIFTIILASCGSKKNIEKTDTPTTPTVTPTITLPKNVTAKLDINIKDKSKGSEMSVDGKLQMRRDEVVRLLITPYGLMEVGRLEFTPDYILLVDRINKEYVKAKYSEVDFLKNNGITFKVMQDRFWEEYKKEHISLDVDKITLKIDVKSTSENGNFDSTTTLSDKFKQVSVNEVLKKLSSM